jgi:hypothetical protein
MHYKKCQFHLEELARKKADAAASSPLDDLRRLLSSLLSHKGQSS